MNEYPDSFWVSAPTVVKDNNDDLPEDALTLDEETLR